ncbi:MAG: hypothetical protein DSY42_04890 [Aquifex sp.]|nr:MAG: hypothetical protein DSY42_04890 [Aquifex sp.]
MEVKAYTIGRGKFLLKPAGESGYIDFGNISSGKLSIKTEKKEHYSTRTGLKVKDAEIIISQDFNIEIEVDELKKEALEMYFLAVKTASNSVAASTTAVQDTVTVKQGMWFPLTNRNIKRDPAPIVSAGTTTYKEGVDYEIDYAAGLIYIIKGGNISDGTSITVEYQHDAWNVEDYLVGGKYSIDGQLWFVADPPKGQVLEIRGNVSLAPSGDFEVVSDDFLKLSFEGTFTEKPMLRLAEVR